MNNYKNIVYLKPDTSAIAILMAENELDCKKLAELSNVGISIIYSLRRGCLTKPIHIGKIAKVLNCNVKDIIVTAPELQTTEGI